MSRTEQLLRDLIALPSVNPAFLPPGHAHAGEQRVAEFLAHRARRAKLDVQFQKVLPGRFNVLIRFTPRERVRRRILLAPHLDTVGVVHQRQFVPRKIHNRLYGRGACDTKGCVAAMFTALCEVAGSGSGPRGTEITFVGLVDEENAQSGSRALVERSFRGDLAIVGEPTQLRVVTAHKGDVWLRLETRGKSAHGARPELGRNAVHEMARIVDLLESGYAARLRGRPRHPLLGRATINVGTIQGGTQPNIVPAACAISIDRRTLPGETDTTVRREIQSLLRAHGLRATLASARNGPCLPLETNPRLPLVRHFLRVAGQSKPAGVDFFCDASVLARGGIASVAFGPGNIAQAHTPDEWIALAQLERGKDLLRHFLQTLP